MIRDLTNYCPQEHQHPQYNRIHGLDLPGLGRVAYFNEIIIKLKNNIMKLKNLIMTLKEAMSIIHVSPPYICSITCLFYINILFYINT